MSCELSNRKNLALRACAHVVLLTSDSRALPPEKLEKSRRRRFYVFMVYSSCQIDLNLLRNFNLALCTR